VLEGVPFAIVVRDRSKESMTMRRRSMLGILAAINALVAALLAIAANAATSTLPTFLDQHPGRAWTLVGVLTVAAIACAVAAVRAAQPDGAQTTNRVRVKGVHAGGDVNVRGQGHFIVGGDHVAINPQQDPPREPKHRRRQ
jgi:hypothetical protein